jgi:hypothetical protein
VASDGCSLDQTIAELHDYRNAWSTSSEVLTEIPRQMLDRDGVPPSEAMKLFLEAVGDRDVFNSSSLGLA